eukprot:6247455-Amphidinium_carterae.1
MHVHQGLASEMGLAIDAENSASFVRETRPTKHEHVTSRLEQVVLKALPILTYQHMCVRFCPEVCNDKFGFVLLDNWCEERGVTLGHTELVLELPGDQQRLL